LQISGAYAGPAIEQAFILRGQGRVEFRSIPRLVSRSRGLPVRWYRKNRKEVSSQRDGLGEDVVVAVE